MNKRDLKSRLKNKKCFFANKNKDNIQMTQLVKLNIDESNFPIFKIDKNGKIIYANQPSLNLLKHMECDFENYLPKYFISKHPEILDQKSDFSIQIETRSTYIHFDIIGFAENGYIGFYGFKIIDKNNREEDILSNDFIGLN